MMLFIIFLFFSLGQSIESIDCPKDNLTEACTNSLYCCAMSSLNNYLNIEDQVMKMHKVVKEHDHEITVLSHKIEANEGPHFVLLKDTETDLGKQLNAAIKNRTYVERLQIFLKRDATYKWDEVVEIPEGMLLEIIPEGYDTRMFKKEIFPTTIKMTKSITFKDSKWLSGEDCRQPSRVVVKKGATFQLTGVLVEESIKDENLSLGPQRIGLIEIDDDYARTFLRYSKFVMSESVLVNVYSTSSFVHVDFESLIVESNFKAVTMMDTNFGWCVGGANGVLTKNAVTLGTQVAFKSLSSFAVHP